ncbi:phosphotransferase [Pseudomonas citronellolis]|uniref:phosphotransferase n=1 Tax=Pseudomonas citronellolis TaxID=53408 RepID=UPI000B1D8D03|nr:phosphotransferase [Pseudomonas citronellolis]
MNPPPPNPQAGRIAFRWRAGTLEQRLAWLFPTFPLGEYSVTSRDLESNASFVNYVRHHRLSDAEGNPVLDLVEKSIRKIAPLSSQEARFHRRYEVLANCKRFHFPQLYGVLETPFESLLYTSLVQGKPPRMHQIGEALGRNIAELELLSHLYLQRRPLQDRLQLWSMDFHRPWFLLRPRFNYQRCLAHLEKFARQDARFRDLSRAFSELRPRLDLLADASRHSPRCFSHMDYLRKNLFAQKGKLQLIDWSEVKVGRVGFDGGAYLGALFRRNDMQRFEQAREAFLHSYGDALDSRFAVEDALRNLGYIFLLTALYHCLRPETLEEYQRNERLPLLREKHDYLLGCLDRTGMPITFSAT